jgi:hypothetical protein
VELNVDEFNRMKKYWHGIRRRTTKSGTLYLEVDERNQHGPSLREWYRVTIRPGEVVDN